MKVFKCTYKHTIGEASVACDAPINWEGKGRHPKYCEAHKGGKEHPSHYEIWGHRVLSREKSVTEGYKAMPSFDEPVYAEPELLDTAKTAKEANAMRMEYVFAFNRSKGARSEFGIDPWKIEIVAYYHGQGGG